MQAVSYYPWQHQDTPLTEFTGRWSGGCVDRGGRCASLNSSKHRLPAVPAVGTGAGCLWCFLPVVIEGNQFPLQDRKAATVCTRTAFPSTHPPATAAEQGSSVPERSLRVPSYSPAEDYSTHQEPRLHKRQKGKMVPTFREP